LTPEEFERIKVHPVVGADILAHVRFPYPVAPLVRAHHESWDGSGYPDGLKGEQIPLGARILAVVDALDATASDRRHRAGLPFDQALAAVAAESGRKFDPAVVAVLRQHADRLEQQVKAEQELSTPILLAPGGGTTTPGRSGRLAVTAAQNSVLPVFLTSIAEARREEKLMQDLTHMLSGSFSLKDSIPALARRLHPHVPFDAFVLYARQDRVLKAIAAAGEHQRHFLGLAVQPGEGLTGWVAEQHKPVLNGNAGVEPCIRACSTRETPLQTALLAPLDGNAGNVGVLAVYTTVRDSYTREHLRLLQSVAAKLAPVVETSLKLHKAETRASVDFLTGLPNAGGLASHLQNEIARCQRTGEDLAVLVCDLDGFKLVNDRFGHLTGNKILQLVAQGLREHCREYDFVARLGGDEFVAVLPGLSQVDVDTKRRRFQAVAAQAGLEMCGQPVLSLSVGAAYYRTDGSTSEELLARADERMYGRKRARKEHGTSASEATLQWFASGSG
jgi:diguanylate cyclase (GGDEF)-like protein